MGVVTHGKPIWEASNTKRVGIGLRNSLRLEIALPIFQLPFFVLLKLFSYITVAVSRRKYSLKAVAVTKFGHMCRERNICRVGLGSSIKLGWAA